MRTPLGIEPGPFMMGSKRVDHWTSGTVYKCSEIAGSPQGSPPSADYVGCEAGRRTCSERELAFCFCYQFFAAGAVWIGISHILLLMLLKLFFCYLKEVPFKLKIKHQQFSTKGRHFD
jgi:hypothetical protein